MQIVFVGLLLGDHRLRRRRRKKPAGKSNISLFRFSDVAEKKKTTFCSCWEVEGNECSFKVRVRVFNRETDVGIRGQCREEERGGRNSSSLLNCHMIGDSSVTRLHTTADSTVGTCKRASLKPNM